MPSQKMIFSESEGDSWFDRNAAVLDEERVNQDPVLSVLSCLELNPENVLEIGASNGWRLARLMEKYGCNVTGVEPSEKAVAQGNERGLNLIKGTADDTGLDGVYDLVILGFCIYLCDRTDLFKIAYEVDRLLSDGGFLFIYDFYSRYPYKNNYKHAPELSSYKFDVKSMFDWNSQYHLLFEQVLSHSGFDTPKVFDPDDAVSVSVLKKETSISYIKNPFKSEV